MALVISFVPDAPKAVAEMKRVVKPHGTVGAYMWDALGGGYVQQPLMAALAAMNVEVAARPGQRNSQINEMYGLFEMAGFQQVAAAPSKSKFPMRISTTTGPRKPGWRTTPFRPSAKCPNQTSRV